MDLRITLAPDGGLRLVLPSNRTLDVGNTASALKYIQRILRDAAEGDRERRGYVREFPTQHVIEIWKRQDDEKKIAATKDRLKEMGIEIDKLEISI